MGEEYKSRFSEDILKRALAYAQSESEKKSKGQPVAVAVEKIVPPASTAVAQFEPAITATSATENPIIQRVAPPILAPAETAPPPIQKHATAPKTDPAEESQGPRVSVYTSLGSHHVGSRTFPTPGNYYMRPQYDWDNPNYSRDTKGNVTGFYPSAGEITGNAGNFNRHFNEKNSGASVNVMWPVAETEHGVVEAGFTVGSYKNSFYRHTTYLAGNLAYRIPNAFENVLGKTSLALGVEAGRATGYPVKFIGQLYGEACQDLSKHFSICAKLGVIPTSFEKARPDQLTGTSYALKPGADAVNKDKNGNIASFNTIEAPQTPRDKSFGGIITKQFGVTYRF